MYRSYRDLRNFITTLKDMGSNIAKKTLRAVVSHRLRVISSDSLLRQSNKVFEKLKFNDLFMNARAVGLFMNMPSGEIHTMDIIEYCFRLKKQVYLPRCETKGGESKMTFIRLNDMRAVLNLQPRGKYGLLEPTAGMDALVSGELDIILVPGVAFTLDGKRLGRGAGYYDKFLSAYCKTHEPMPYLIGLSLDEQIVDDIPLDDHDWCLDEVVRAGE